MTKNTKIAAIVSAAALLAIGASMTSFAATGWQEEDGTWVYYDKYEERVTADWAKSGDNWYYLNDDGEMATDQIIEDDDNFYYVDANGAMVTNNWVEIDNSDDDDEDAPATVWYFFQSNGKAYKAGTNNKASWKTINGKKYVFDEDGKMQFGWVNEEGIRETGDEDWKTGLYYCGQSDDGARMENAWGLIHVIDDDPDVDDEDQDYWFYFGSNAKKYASSLSTKTTLYEKTVNGKKYTFGEYGNMLSEWVATPDAASSATAYKYFSDPESGARVTKGWFRVYPDENFDYDDAEDQDAEYRWFYADGKGKLYTSQIKKINGKKYAFDEDGEMLYGLCRIDVNSSSKITSVVKVNIDSEDDLNDYTDIGAVEPTDSKSGVYFFGDQVTDGAMKTGSTTVVVDGDSYSFKFTNNGVGEKGKKDNAYYVNGRKVKADSELKYVAYAVDGNGAVVATLAANDLWDDSQNSLTDGETLPSKDLKYKGSKKSYDNSTVPSGCTVVVLTSGGTIVKTGTKKDGDDYKLVVKNSVLQGVIVDE